MLKPIFDSLNVGDGFSLIGTKDFKDTVEGSFTERWEIELGKNFRPTDLGVRTLYAEIIG